MVLIAQRLENEDIAQALLKPTWSPLIGALLVCGINPVASAGPLTEADCKTLARVSTAYRTALRIVSLWNTQNFASVSPSPNAFLLWCKYRRIREVDWFLQKVAEVAQRFLNRGDPERFSDSQRLRAAYQEAFALFAEDSWGVPDSQSTDDRGVWSEFLAHPAGQPASQSAEPASGVSSIDRYPTSGVIAKVFDGCIWSKVQWSTKLKDPGDTQWLIDARKASSGAGSDGAVWDPIRIALALNAGVKKKLTDQDRRDPQPGDTRVYGIRKTSKARLQVVFKRPELQGWQDDWERAAEFID